MITNVPYVKEYNSLGICINPIKGEYIHKFPNRKARRAHLNQPPFHGNGKNYHLTVNGHVKYRRVMQRIGSKTILHYLS